MGCGSTVAAVALGAGGRCEVLYALEVSASTIKSDASPQRAGTASHCGGVLVVSQLMAGPARANSALSTASTGVITATPTATEVRKLVSGPVEAVREAVVPVVVALSVDG